VPYNISIVGQMYDGNLVTVPNSRVTWLKEQQGLVFGTIHIMEALTVLGSFFTYSKINACDTIHDDEDVGICELVKAVIQANGKHEHHELQIKVKRRPCCRLMFRNGCNDGNVVLSIRWIQQRVEATSPGRDFTGKGKDTTNS